MPARTSDEKGGRLSVCLSVVTAAAVKELGKSGKICRNYRHNRVAFFRHRVEYLTV